MNKYKLKLKMLHKIFQNIKKFKIAKKINIFLSKFFI